MQLCVECHYSGFYFPQGGHNSQPLLSYVFVYPGRGSHIGHLRSGHTVEHLGHPLHTWSSTC